MFAEVIIDIKNLKINQNFDYIIPKQLEGKIIKGMRVYVPFGETKRVGYVTKIKPYSNLANREIIEVIDALPIFSEELFLIVDYLLDNPQTIIAKAFETVIPNDLILDYEKIVRIINKDLIPESIKDNFNNKGKWLLSANDNKYYSLLKRLEKDNIIKINSHLKERVKQKEEIYLKYNYSSYKLNDAQKEIIDLVNREGEIKRSELLNYTTLARINTLIKNNVLEVIYKPITLEKEDYLSKNKLPKLENNLNDDIKKISNDNKHFLFKVNDFDLQFDLLLNIINYFLNNNKQILILVSEIFLAQSLYNKIINYYSEEITFLIDSSKTHKQRYLSLESILKQNKSIIIGARSNVFTEANNLGGLIILNDYDSSFISLDGIYYNTNDILKIRSKYHNIPLISITNQTSLENELLIKNKEITMFDYTKYLNKEIIITDLKEELINGNTKIISNKLKEEIDNTLNEHNNVLLIMNQKGYAPFVMCRSCSYVPTLKNTNIPLNYVKSENVLRSNLIKYEEPFSIYCPKCGRNTLRPVGVGIEKLNEEIKQMYPNYNLIIITQDTLSSKEANQLISNLDYKAKTIITGTEMALKQILNKKVALVGIILLEQFLKRPHYNGYYEAFSLLNNAFDITSEKLLIQTYESNHDIIKSINNHELFYKDELRKRRLAKLPPYYQLLQVMTEGESYLKTYQQSFILKNLAISNHLEAIGPSPSSYLIKNNKYRFLLLIKYQDKLPQTIIDFIQKKNEFINFTTKDVVWY